MSKIKLVIEIPQEVHEHAKNTSEDRTDEYSAMRAIANGTPLDDIKKEIDKKSDMHMDGEFYIRNIDVKRILSGNEVSE